MSLSIRHSFDRAASQYDQHAEVQRKVAWALCQIMPPDVANTSRFVLDLGSGTGFLGKCVQDRYPRTTLVSADAALHMLTHTSHVQGVCADMEHLPFKPVFDWVISNCALQWSTDLSNSLSQISAALVPGGEAFISLFVEGTLHELEDVYHHVGHIPVISLANESDVIRSADQSGFDVLATRLLRQTCYYQDFLSCIRHVKGMGSRYLAYKGLRTPRQYKVLEEAYTTRYSLENKGLPASFVAGIFHLKKRA